MLILGPALSLVPSKAIYLASLLVFTLGSLICGVAKSFTTLVVGRAIAGWGGGGYYISPLPYRDIVKLILFQHFHFNPGRNIRGMSIRSL